MLNSRIKKIVLTGGPCAGKTRLLDDIENYLREKGYYVITLPETATQLIGSSMLPCMDREQILIFQDIVLKMQKLKEQEALRYAENILEEKKVIILCDRAIMDNRAYLESQEDFEFLLNKNGLDEQEVIHSYDLVIDLISTATCKSELYQLDGIRKENVKEAALLDKKTTLAWIAHPHLKVIKPTEEIEEKSSIVIDEVDKFLRGIEYNHRLVRPIDESVVLGDYDSDNFKLVDVYKAYLKDDLVVTKKKYRGSSIMILGKYKNSFENRIITGEEFTDLIYRKPIVFTEQLREISFTENGNVYKIIENGGKYYFEFDKIDTDARICTFTSINNKKFVKKND